jgi:hypothetical protein
MCACSSELMRRLERGRGQLGCTLSAWATQTHDAQSLPHKFALAGLVSDCVPFFLGSLIFLLVYLLSFFLLFCLFFLSSFFLAFFSLFFFSSSSFPIFSSSQLICRLFSSLLSLSLFLSLLVGATSCITLATFNTCCWTTRLWGRVLEGSASPTPLARRKPFFSPSSFSRCCPLYPASSVFR